MLIAAKEKKKYLTAGEAHCVSSSPFVATVDGALGHDAVLFFATYLKDYHHAGMKVMVRCLGMIILCHDQLEIYFLGDHM